MARAFSLRARLTAIILVPLLVIAAVIGAVAVRDAQQRADARFNRALLSAALAVSRDVALSDGDALSPETNALLRDTSGGEVYYHVFAPDGVFVTGYATPPVPTTATNVDTEGQQFFDGSYQNRPIRAVRFVDAMQVDGVVGLFTVTVWQDRALLQTFAQDLSWRTLQVIGWLVATVALVVWFGVRLGLRPLTDLQNAIGQRSSDDLAPIRRAVPVEAQGIVDTLNGLFTQVSRSMTAQAEFVSNAAHQLKNPIAGVLALAEAVKSAPDHNAATTRAAELIDAAKEAATLSEKLLTIERAKAIVSAGFQENVDLVACLRDWVPDLSALAGPDVPVALDTPAHIAPLTCDPTMVREALRNLVDNARRHGGAGLSRITITLGATRDAVIVQVRDDGKGIPTDKIPNAVARFSQVTPGEGSGLGLPIAQAVATGHGGDLVVSSDDGLTVQFTLKR